MKKRKKIPHYKNPKMVTFEDEKTPNEYFVEIGLNHVITSSRKKNQQEKCKSTMSEDYSNPIDYEKIVDLNETHLNRNKMK